MHENDSMSILPGERKNVWFFKSGAFTAQKYGYFLGTGQIDALVQKQNIADTCLCKVSLRIYFISLSSRININLYSINIIDYILF